MKFELNQTVYFRHYRREEFYKGQVIEITPRKNKKPYVLLSFEDEGNYALTYWKKDQYWALGRSWLVISKQEYLRGPRSKLYRWLQTQANKIRRYF